MSPQVPALDAEAAVLSALLLEPALVPRLQAVLAPKHFFADANRWVAEAIFAVSGAGQPADVVTVAGWLRDKDRINQVGGSAYLAQLVDTCPFIANVESYARIVVQKATVRQTIATCQRIAADGYGADGTSEDFVSRASSALEQILRQSRFVHAKQTIFSERDLFAAVADAMIAGAPQRRCTMGIPDLDVDVGGHKAGMVTWMGAATNWGKSSFAVMTYDEAVKQGKRVLLVSCEDKPELFARRILARRANLSAYALREHALDKDSFDRLLGVATAAGKTPFFVEGIGVPVEEIAERIRYTCETEQVDLVMVDYLQAISCEKRLQDKRVETTYIARRLTDAIKTGNAAGLLFSQIKRLENGKVPDKHDLKESGDVENMAENVFLGFNNERGESVLRADKAKDAQKNDYLMTWDGLSCSFRGGKRIEAGRRA